MDKSRRNALLICLFAAAALGLPLRLVEPDRAPGPGELALQPVPQARPLPPTDPKNS